MSKLPFPIIYCDENLTIADISPSERDGDYRRLIGTSMKKHLDNKDVSAILSCLNNGFSKEQSRLIVFPEKMKGAKIAHVSKTELFGHTYFEIRLFRSTEAMLRDVDLTKDFPFEPPYIPEYKFERDRITVNESRDKLEKFFSSGYLRNLYYSALDPLRQIMRFDTVDVTRRIIADFSFSLALGKTKFPFYVEDEENFRHEVIDASNYVNLVALLMKIFAHVSKSGEVRTTLSSKEDKVSLLLITTAKEGKVVYYGGFAFHFLADMYPEIASYIWAAKYISELFGLRCYGELSGKNTLAAELLMRPAPPDIEVGVMHPDGQKLDELCTRAAILVDDLKDAYIPQHRRFEEMD